jgi:hypothetical protein
MADRGGQQLVKVAQCTASMLARQLIHHLLAP